MISAFKNILKINISFWIFLLFMGLLCNFKDLEVRADEKEQTEIDAKCQIGVELNNGNCQEVVQLTDAALNRCETAGCSHSCLKSAGKAFCVCPDGMELGHDWKTCHESNEDGEEDAEDEVEENEEEDDENNAGNDGSKEYEDEIGNSDREDDKKEIGKEKKKKKAKESQLESNKLEESRNTDKEIKEENEERHSEQDKIVENEENGNSEEDVVEYSKGGGNGDKIFDGDALENDMKEKSEKEVQKELDNHEESSEIGNIDDKNESNNETEDGEQFFGGENVAEEVEKVLNYNKEVEISNINALNAEAENEENEENEEELEEDYGDEDENYDENEEETVEDNKNQIKVTTEESAEVNELTKLEESSNLEKNESDGRRNNEISATSKTNEESNLVLVDSSREVQITTENYIETSSKSGEEEEYGEKYDEDDNYYDNVIKNNETITNVNVENVTKSADELTKIDDKEVKISGKSVGSKIDVTANDRHEEITINNVFSSSEEVEEEKHIEGIEEKMKNNITNERTKDNKQTEDDYEEYEEEDEEESKNNKNDEDNKFIANNDDKTNNIFNLTTIETTEESCEIGFEKNANESICVDVNECVNEELNVCEQNCINTISHFYCTCDSGYELSVEDNSSCSDVDECKENICSHNCVNTLGSYDCVCPDGYYLKDNRRECVAINCTHGYDFNKSKNELKCVCPDSHFLARDNSTCVHNDDCESSNNCSQLCRNRNECFCYEGYILLEDGMTCREEIVRSCELGFEYSADAKSCADFDECLNLNLTHCAQICVNIVGSYECACNIGYQLQINDISCADIDECTLGMHECQHECFNNIGSYNCACRNGFELLADQKHCRDVDECENNNGNCSHDCKNSAGRFKCDCPANFELAADEMTCAEVDLCSVNNGGCSHGCLSAQGQILCSCPEGFELRDRFCKKINPCERDNGGCSHFCEIHADFVQCKCPERYKLHNDTHCDKINPCFEFNNGCSHICESINDNTTICKCPDDSFELVDKTCYKINLCAINNGGCSHNCLFSDEKVHCTCPKNHQLIGDNKTCLEINPCRESNGNCSHECTFSDGVKECLCPKGLELLKNQLDCVWIDACRENNGNCSHKCDSVHGQAICECPSRFELVNKTCIRINPCLINNGGCSHNCHGTFRRRVKCSCPSTNYILHGKTCLENDLCRKVLNGGCSHICSEEYGRKICKCPLGFILKPDGLTCKDINECKIGNGGCSHGCVNALGSYNCACAKGLQLDNSKLICQDVDECQDSSSCEQVCTNYHGGFRCSCRVGFVLDIDGRRCRPGGFFECPNFSLSPSEGGNVRCLGANVDGRRYVPAGTRCVVWCDKGYKLNGDAIHLCQISGNWSTGLSPSCIRTTCRKVPNPNDGRLIPNSCTSAKTFVGGKCRIYCRRGFRNLPGYEYIQCQTDLQWTTISAKKAAVSFEQIQAACVPADIPKPFILCPERGRLTFELPLGQSEMQVQIPRPKSNVDWWKYIHAEPLWAKSLAATLPSGRVEVKYTAYSPVTNDTSASCHLVIEVKDGEAPTVVGCPEDIVVQLWPGEARRIVYWREPEVTDNVGVRTLYKSKDSGSQFGIGKHYINYVVSDDEGNRAYCHFNVIVTGAYDEISSNKYRAALVCPDGIHMAEIHDSNDRNLQAHAGCYWKHVRVTASLKMTTPRPVNYFQRQYPDPYQFSHANYPFNSDRVQTYRNNYQLQNRNSYKPFDWYNRCC